MILRKNLRFNYERYKKAGNFPAFLLPISVRGLQVVLPQKDFYLKSKKRNCPEERKKPGNDTLGQKKVQFRKDNFTLLKTKNSVAAKSENFSTSGDRGEILRFRFVSVEKTPTSVR